MNEVIEIHQKFNDYSTTIKVDGSVKKFIVEFQDGTTKVKSVIVELKDSKQ
jgi:hypothetical protein